MVQEFKFLGFNMEKISSFYGIFLIIWGIFISLFSDSNSFTSYIPSIIGFCVLFFSVLALYLPQKKEAFYAYCSFYWANYSFGRIRHISKC